MKTRKKATKPTKAELRRVSAMTLKLNVISKALATVGNRLDRILKDVDKFEKDVNDAFWFDGHDDDQGSDPVPEPEPVAAGPEGETADG